MGYRAMFAAGFAIGYVVGTRAGRERYEQIVKVGRQVAEHPAVQKATQTVTTKTTEITKTASAQVPKIVTSAKKAATDRLPSRLGGKGEAADDADDVSADGHLIYPAEDSSQAAAEGAR